MALLYTGFFLLQGRYVALETLLPIVGATSLISYGGDELIASLVRGIGDRSHNPGTIAELLGRLLSKLLDEMNKDHGIVDTRRKMNKKERKKAAAAAAGSDSGDGTGKDFVVWEPLPIWVEAWAPHFASGLLSSTNVRWKQTSAFCLSLLRTMSGEETSRADAASLSVALLETLQSTFDRLASTAADSSVLRRSESLTDRYCWAQLEVRY